MAMKWFFGLVAVALVGAAPMSKTHEILWDVSNDLFQSRVPTKSVQLGDRIDFTCSDEHSVQTYIVPDLRYFENCDAASHEFVFFSCRSASEVKSIRILEVNPSPFAPQFTPGKEYYLISTGTGTLDTIKNLHGGLCSDQNLRLVLKIEQPSSDEGLARIVPETELEGEVVTPDLVRPSTDSSGRSIEAVTSKSIEEKIQEADQETTGQVNQLLVGVALGVLIFLIVVFTGVLLYFRFCAGGRKKARKSTHHSQSASSDPEYNFNDATYIDIQKPKTVYYTTSDRHQGIHGGHPTMMQSSNQSSPDGVFQSPVRYHNATVNGAGVQSGGHIVAGTQRGYTVRQAPVRSQTQTYLYNPESARTQPINLPFARQMVGEPSQNAFLSIAKRVDPTYAHDVSQPPTQATALLQQSVAYPEQHLFPKPQELSGYDTMDSAEKVANSRNSSHDSGDGPRDRSHDPLLQGDGGYEGSSAVMSNDGQQAGSSQASPKGAGGYQPRLENGGLVISV